MTGSLDVVLFRRLQPADLQKLLDLQEQNLVGNLKDEEARNGFLSLRYTGQQFVEIDRDLGIAVAVQEGEVLGYLCATTFAYARQFPILNETIRNLDGLFLEGLPLGGERTFLYGPVCIGSSFRGMGLLAGLFATMKQLSRPRYSACALFISERNTRSYQAHVRKLGMTDLGMFEFTGKRFHLVAAIL